MYQYGLSARGDRHRRGRGRQGRGIPRTSPTSISSRPRARATTVTVYALLDGPSITGAYKFVMQRGRAWSWTWNARCSCARTWRGWGWRRSRRCTGSPRP
ncbi:glucan biosynthesis protein [Cupriavidus basilensis]